MIIPIEKHIDFYKLEIKTVLEKWENYLAKQMKILISEKELFIGRLWAYEEKSGIFILRFKATEVPRTNTPYFIGFLGNGAIGNPSGWTFSYKDFRESEKSEYWNRKGGEINVVNYWKTENDWSFLIVNVVDIQLHEFIIREYIGKGIHPLFVVAEADPPINYLVNLKEYVESNENDKTLRFEADKNPDTWKPINIDNSSSYVEEILSKIEENKTTVIQGPPGTGKSYFAAQVCDSYLSKNKSICVCALTNKAIMEIINQPPLTNALISGLIYKTSVSKEESLLQPNLNPVVNFTPKQGELLTTTYYKLTDFYKELSKETLRFDLLIIEEASQAFLAAISMFSRLSDKILIIGDHKQLSPIVVSTEKSLKNLHPNIRSLINGLETYILNVVDNCYRFTKTRRLTKTSAELTGLFYDNQLESISPLNNIKLNTDYPKSVFDENGGVSLTKLSKVGEHSMSEEELRKTIVLIAKDILATNKEVTVSILVSTVDMEKKFCYSFSKEKLEHKRITISTIHKVQGLTCDYTIFYAPLTHVFFELNDNLFNVATSRAKKGCLIITYRHINLVEGISSELSNFLKRCTDVTNQFVEILQRKHN